MKSSILRNILDVSIALCAEKNPDTLLNLILNVAMNITNCDAGTLYIKNDNNLLFKVMITRSMGKEVQNADLPPVKITKRNVCSCSMIENKTIYIDDVYASNEYDFIGPQKYDALTGYKTSSMLVIPMTDNKGEKIGVIQLINALSEDGDIIPFSKEFEEYILALSSQAAISLTNTNQALEIENLLISLVRTLSTAIYERTPYNVTHTQNMSLYADKFIDWLSVHHPKLAFTPENKSQFLMAVMLHDVGKLTVPLEVMNKETRLSSALDKVLTRFQIIDLTARLAKAEGRGDYLSVKKKLDYAQQIIFEANTISFLNDELENEVKKIAKNTYTDVNGVTHNWLLNSELAALCIKKGTLTASERTIMETHVETTSRILDEIAFTSKYSMVTKWAQNHHEFLDGSGYPNRLTAVDLGFEERLLTIIDVFDGLSAKDRPYKSTIPTDKVFEILGSMVEENKIDGEILELFKQSRVWEIKNDL